MRKIRFADHDQQVHNSPDVPDKVMNNQPVDYPNQQSNNLEDSQKKSTISDSSNSGSESDSKLILLINSPLSTQAKYADTIVQQNLDTDWLVEMITKLRIKDLVKREITVSGMGNMAFIMLYSQNNELQTRASRIHRKLSKIILGDQQSESSESQS